jgi:WD40 repeat protein
MTAVASSPPRLNPYVGPRPFERGQRLYGRDREVTQLRDLLIAERIVLFYSPSGAGKTSLIRASLVPELEREGFRVLPEIRVMAELGPVGDTTRPWNRYLLSTLLSLEQDLPPDRQHDLGDLAGVGLGDYLEQYDGEHDGDVLIFDQFEELLADTTDQDAKAAFFAELGAVLRDTRRWALFAMREDFVAGLDPYLRLLPTRLRTRFRLDLLGEAAARMAIQGPARQAGVDFSDAAAQKLVDNLRRVHVRRPGGPAEALGPYIEPVQLQVVCERLWEQPRADALRITEADVQEIGDVDSALAGYYAEKVQAVARETGMDERAIRTWFDNVLITEQDLRAQVLAGPLDHRSTDDQVLRLLEDSHLIRAETRGGARWFELAHDRLIRPVRTNNVEWRETNLQPFQLQAPLWQREHRPDGLLLIGDALTEADRWVQEHPGELEPIEREFLAASRRAQRLARRVRHLAIATSIVSVIAVLAFIGMFYTYRSGGSRLLGAQAMLQLETDPARALGTAIQALDRWSTPLAQEALTSSLARSHLRTILSGHTGSVNMVEFSPDGRLVVTVGDEGLARTWNTITGQPLAVFGSDIFTARFSPDGSRVVVTASGDNTARVWDAQTGREQAVLRGHQGGVISAQWSPDGSRIVTASSDATARVWDARTGREQTMLSGHEGAVLSVEWNPDEVGIVTGSSDGTARVWNADTGEQLTPFQPSAKPERIATARFSPDGTHIIVATEPALTTQAAASYLWQWANGTPVPLPGGNPKFSPDGRYLLTVDAQTVRIWDARTGERVIELEGHEGRVTVARFNTDGTRIVSGSQDRTARIWDVATGTMLGELRGHDSDVTDVALSPHQPDPFRLMVVTASADSTARVWQPSIGRVLSGSADWMNRTRFNADGTLVVGAGQDGVVRIWRADTGQQLAGLPASSQPLGDAAFSQDGRYVVAGGDDGTVRIWQWRTGTPPVAQLQVGGQVSAVGFDPSGRFVVIAGVDNDARIWQWATGTPPQLLRGHESPVIDATFSPDGALIVTASLDQTARIWDTATAAQLHILEGHTREVRRAAFSPNGRVVVTASEDQTARTWDVATGRQRLSLADHQGELQDAEFSPDGRYLVTGDVDGMVGVWNATTGNKLGLLPLHTNTVTSVGFSPTSHLILTASTDRTPRIYDCEICAPLHDLRQLAEDRQRYAQM